MIVGRDLTWKHILCSKILTWQGNKTVASHELGTLWLRANNESHCHLDVHTLNGSQTRTPTSAVCPKIRLNPSDRHDDEPFVHACERTICAHSRTVLFAHTHGLF